MPNTKPELTPHSAPHTASMQDAVRLLLESSGFSMDEPHLQDTPQRVATCWQTHLLDGHQMDAANLLSETFPSEGQGLIVAKDIFIQGLCPHHLLPFFGRAHIAYHPDKHIVGFSKLAELLQCFSHRLTLQEKVTQEVCNALEQHLGAKGTGCIIEATHTCMILRGGEQRQSQVLTSQFTGTLRDNPPWQQMMPSSRP